MSHAGLVRTPQARFPDRRKANRKRSRQRRRGKYLEADVSAREGTWGRRNAPRSQHDVNLIFRHRIVAEFKLKRGTNRRRTIFLPFRRKVLTFDFSNPTQNALCHRLVQRIRDSPCLMQRTTGGEPRRYAAASGANFLRSRSVPDLPLC